MAEYPLPVECAHLGYKYIFIVGLSLSNLVWYISRQAGLSRGTLGTPAPRFGVFLSRRHDSRILWRKRLGQLAVPFNFSRCRCRRLRGHHASTLCFCQFSASELSTWSTNRPLPREPPFTTSNQGFCTVSLCVRHIRVVPPLTPERFRDWTQKYGSIIGLKFGPTNVVILNNYKDVQE